VAESEDLPTDWGRWGEHDERGTLNQGEWVSPLGEAFNHRSAIGSRDRQIDQLFGGISVHWISC
jgi:hypothetical protein